jgi:acetylornithine/succinyldiaminopimelate/putrescine aminotransferase
MIRDRIPNLFRLYLNPFVAQACYALTRFVGDAWPGLANADDYQVFLANSGEEALSGAIKLARYVANAEGFSGDGIILDEDGRFQHFASTELQSDGTVQFIPGLEVVNDRSVLDGLLTEHSVPPGFVVVPHEMLLSEEAPVASLLATRTSEQPFPVLIACSEQRHIGREVTTGIAPDIVVCDESFVNREVPFGAFVGSHRLYQHWNRKGMATFHSTTYQPNTVSTLQLMNALRASVPEFIARHDSALQRIEHDPEFCREQFRDLYSRSLAKLTSLVGFDQGQIQTDRHFVSVAGKRLYDGVAGVACSIRGHNPPNVIRELEELGDADSCRVELAERLGNLTGLPNFAPAVSGGSAVEQALKLGLASQAPRDYVLALRGGFGGKTLFALTGTWKSTLKTGLTPLYPNVVYVDPFADDAVSALEAAVRDYPIGVVQLELVQGVGGVRAIPESVLKCIDALRSREGFLLFVDEVQTGMFRTGPFVRSRDIGIQPDLMSIGKATSDMMFPFGLTLYSNAIRTRLEERQCSLPAVLESRYGYETGVKAVLNTLRRADHEELSQRVRERGELFARLLKEQLGHCSLVRDIRCFGLLIGIELDADRRPHRWLKKLVYQLYLLAMINHPEFPLLVGFCQYEPNVLKFTPPLTVTEDEVRKVCATLASVLSRPLSQVALAGISQVLLRRRSGT